MVRFATTPIPFPGMYWTSKGGGGCELGELVSGDATSGSDAISWAISGLNELSVKHDEESHDEEELVFTSVSAVTAGYVSIWSQVENDEGSWGGLHVERLRPGPEYPLSRAIKGFLESVVKKVAAESEI